MLSLLQTINKDRVLFLYFVHEYGVASEMSVRIVHLGQARNIVRLENQQFKHAIGYVGNGSLLGGAVRLRSELPLELRFQRRQHFIHLAIEIVRRATILRALPDFEL